MSSNEEGKIVRRATSRATRRNDTGREVDAYIEAAPKEARITLVHLRKIVKAAAPGVNEGISYRMPYYDYNGALVWFAAFKNHIGLFIRPPVIEEHMHELNGYETTKSTVRFPIGTPLPVALIKKLVKARVAKNTRRVKKPVRRTHRGPR